MKFLPGSWHIPSGVQQCHNWGTPITCNFSLYTGMEPLAEAEKLAPNPSITGSLIFKSFLVTACTSITLSIFLFVDKILYQLAAGKPNHVSKRKHWIRAIHMIETALHALSDQQLVSGISLLFILNTQACTIPAYDFNVICTMLTISVVVHLGSLVMISDFINKGKSIAFTRIASITLQLVLTGIVFSARNTAIFPLQSERIAIMPAACFENTNATNAAGLSDFLDFVSNITTNATLTATNTTGNGTETFWHNIEAATNAKHGLPEYIVLVVFVLLAVAVLLCEWAWSKTVWGKKVGWGSVVVSFLCTITSAGLIIYALQHHYALADAMEVPDLYQTATLTPLTLSQILPLTLLTSTIFPLIQALSGSLPERGRRYVTNTVAAAGEYADVLKAGDP